MNVTAGTLLMKLAVGESPQEYPVTLSRVRADYPNTSFAAEPSEELINAMGYLVVESTPMPAGDVVTEGEPELVEGKYRQTWTVRDYTPEEEVEELALRKPILTAEIENLRIQTLEAGFLFDFGGEYGELNVQCRAQDRINLIASRIDADAYVAAGQGTQLLPFRTFENIIVQIPATELVAMTNAALSYIRAVYYAGWVLKDQVDAATTLEALPTIPETLTI